MTLDNRHSAILQMLRAHCDKTTEDAPLANLVFQLLIRKPEQRWSVGRVLEHHCRNPIMQEEKKDSAEEGPFRSKRTQLKDLSSKHNSSDMLFRGTVCQMKPLTLGILSSWPDAIDVQRSWFLGTFSQNLIEDFIVF